jgi:hypothetical protein
LKSSIRIRENCVRNGAARQAGRQVVFAVTAVCLALALSGCLITRVVEVQDQLCDFDSNFSLEFAESAGFNFHNPVLLDKDILWIAGAPPTETRETGGVMSMAYVLEKTGPDRSPEDDIRVDLEFEKTDQQYRLMSVRFDPKLNALINPEFLDETAIDSATRTICEMGWSFASAKVEMDISDQDLDELPNRVEILDWLGPPLEADEGNDSITYEYKLKGDEPDSMKARFTVWFDESGEKPARMDSEYSHFQTKADFINKKMLMKVKI